MSPRKRNKGRERKAKKEAKKVENEQEAETREIGISRKEIEMMVTHAIWAKLGNGYVWCR